NQVGSLSKIRKSSSKLEQQFERPPTPEELADDLETTVEKISDSLANAGRHLSFDAPFVTGEENTLLDVMQSTEAGTDSVLITDSLSQEIRRSLGILADRERHVIILFFGLDSGSPHSLEEIGEKFSLTRERVRQIKDKALMRLRQNSKARILQSYL
ncbi:MAG: sigma factor-like helix-turn-helix DNA-binding protein, partial [Mucilaginibacter sp.]